MMVTYWKHPSISSALILAGTIDQTREEARDYFYDAPEKMNGVEDDMSVEEFRNLPEFEG